MVLIHGVEDVRSKFSTVSQNFALTSALYISALLPLLASPPTSITNSDKSIKAIYFTVAFISLIFPHCLCLISSVHANNWFPRFGRDADWIEYCMNHNIESIRDLWIVTPLIIGIAAALISVCLAGCVGIGSSYQQTISFFVQLVPLVTWF